MVGKTWLSLIRDASVLANSLFHGELIIAKLRVRFSDLYGLLWGEADEAEADPWSSSWPLSLPFFPTTSASGASLFPFDGGFGGKFKSGSGAAAPAEVAGLSGEDPAPNPEDEEERPGLLLLLLEDDEAAPPVGGGGAEETLLMEVGLSCWALR